MADAVKQTILVVEGEALIQELLRTTLEDAGFEARVVSDDIRAIAILEANRARDLAGLVTDVNLRRARTGWDIARKARQLNPALPVVYMTSDSSHDWSAQGVPQSVLIHKPFAGAQVVVALSSLLNRVDPDA